MNRRVHLALNLAALALMALGCARRQVPSTFPESSPASLSSEEARPARLTLALDEDPPLPCEDTRGWKGLETAEEPKKAGHEHHQHGSTQANEPTESGSASSVHEGHSSHEGHGAPKLPQAPDSPPSVDHSQHESSPEKEEGASVYSCPMHADVVSNKPDRCPRCGMKLVKKP